MPPGRGAQFSGLANIATAGASAVAGLLGVLVDVGNHYLPGGTYGITFGVCTPIMLAALWPLRRLPKDGAAGQPGQGTKPAAAGASAGRGGSARHVHRPEGAGIVPHAGYSARAEEAMPHVP